MKAGRVSIVQKVVYLFFAIVIIIALYANTVLIKFSHNVRDNIIPVVTLLNPMQYTSNTVYNIIHYITDFMTLYQQLKQAEYLQLNIVMLTNENNVLKKNGVLLSETMRDMSNRYVTIIKFLYSTSGNTIKEAFFETPVNINANIKVNSVILQDGCVIGRVYKQDEKYSYVLLHMDEQFRMPVYTEKSRVFGMVYGGNNLKFIAFSGTDEDQVQDGEKITIAPSDGIFAEGMDFGTVSHLNDGSINVNTLCKGYYAYALVL